MADLIAQRIKGQCTFIDSLKVVKLSDVKTVDALHLTKDLGKKWGQNVYQDIVKKSSLLQQTVSPKAPKTNSIK